MNHGKSDGIVCWKCGRDLDTIEKETGQQQAALYILKDGWWCYECLARVLGDKQGEKHG